MKYSDGVEVRLGDRIMFVNGDKGLIVASIDSDEYSKEFPKSDWAGLQHGTLFKTDNGALVHLDQTHAGDITRLLKEGDNSE